MIEQFTLPVVPKTAIIQKESSSLLERSRDLKIENEDGYLAAWALVGKHDEALERIKQVFDPFVLGLNKLHKMACDLRRGFIEPLECSKSSLLTTRAVYRFEQERLKKIEDDKRAAELQAQQKKELEREAKKLQKAGDNEAAEVLREEAKIVPLPVMAPTAAVPQSAGSVIRQRWTFDVIDADKVEREYCEPSMTKIRKVVEALGDKARISGIRIYKEVKEHSRSVRQ